MVSASLNDTHANVWVFGQPWRTGRQVERKTFRVAISSPSGKLTYWQRPAQLTPHLRQDNRRGYSGCSLCQEKRLEVGQACWVICHLGMVAITFLRPMKDRVK